MGTSLVDGLLGVSQRSAEGALLLLLLEEPCLVGVGRPRQIPEGSKRLVALVALRGRPVDRRHVAGLLWPDGGEERAAGNLRSALWRLRKAGIDVVDGDQRRLWLTAGVGVDVRLLTNWSTRVLRGTASAADLDVGYADAGSAELLPGWNEEWVLLDRERLRQRVLHALEVLSRSLGRRGLTAEAVDVATALVGADPLRESAQRVLIEAHLAEGNLGEARRCYRDYGRVLRRELDVGIGPALRSVVGEWMASEAGGPPRATVPLGPGSTDDLSQRDGGGPHEVGRVR